MSESKIARRYARALLDLCGSGDEAAGVGAELASFAAAYEESSELRTVFTNPTVAPDVKSGVLDDIAAKSSVSTTTRDFLRVLLESGRMPEIAGISQNFGELADELRKRVRAEVISARPLEASDVARIQAALERLTGGTVEIAASVDASLVGGVVTRIGGKVIDGSVRTRLDALRERLLA